MAENNKPLPIAQSVLAQFEPIARLSANRLEELAGVCFAEEVSKNLDPTRMSSSAIWLSTRANAKICACTNG
mgnify:CR=1 FL=1